VHQPAAAAMLQATGRSAAGARISPQTGNASLARLSTDALRYNPLTKIKACAFQRTSSIVFFRSAASSAMDRPGQARQDPPLLITAVARKNAGRFFEQFDHSFFRGTLRNGLACAKRHQHTDNIEYKSYLQVINFVIIPRHKMMKAIDIFEVKS
jgi:hypothetical protein